MNIRESEFKFPAIKYLRPLLGRLFVFYDFRRVNELEENYELIELTNIFKATLHTEDPQDYYLFCDRLI